MDLIEKYIGEGNKKLPPHIKDLMKKLDKKDKKKSKKFGFSMKDVTPKGYGPNEAKSTGATQMECMECGHKFKKKIGKNTIEVKCPKCKGYDTDIA